MAIFFRSNPSDYGLSKRLILLHDGHDNYILERIIKSRIIKKDALNILEVLKAVRAVNSRAELTLRCTRNICSKSLELLDQNKVKVVFAE